MSQKTRFWFLLVDFDGQTYQNSEVTSLLLDSHTIVDDFKTEAHRKVEQILTNISASQLLIYKNLESFSKKEQPLDVVDEISGLGESPKTPILVVTPVRNFNFNYNNESFCIKLDLNLSTFSELKKSISDYLHLDSDVKLALKDEKDTLINTFQEFHHLDKSYFIKGSGKKEARAYNFYYDNVELGPVQAEQTSSYQTYLEFGQIIKNDAHVQALLKEIDALSCIASRENETLPFIFLDSSSGMGKTQMAFNLMASGKVTVHSFFVNWMLFQSKKFILRFQRYPHPLLDF